MLEHKKAEMWLTDSYKVSKFIDTEFGIGFGEDYELNAMEECNNYCWKKFIVDGDVGEYDLKDINEMLETKKYKMYNTGTILNYLCKEGKLEPGDYMVDVSW